MKIPQVNLSKENNIQVDLRRVRKWTYTQNTATHIG